MIEEITNEEGACRQVNKPSRQKGIKKVVERFEGTILVTVLYVDKARLQVEPGEKLDSLWDIGLDLLWSMVDECILEGCLNVGENPLNIMIARQDNKVVTVGKEFGKGFKKNFVAGHDLFEFPASVAGTCAAAKTARPEGWASEGKQAIPQRARFTVTKNLQEVNHITGNDEPQAVSFIGSRFCVR